MTCGECPYWDKKYNGFLGDIYKPCTHPSRPKRVGKSSDGSEIKYTDNHECILKINKM